MKQNETSLTVGVDVSKQRLDVFEYRTLMAEAKHLGWAAEVARCRAFPGVGPRTA